MQSKEVRQDGAQALQGGTWVGPYSPPGGGYSGGVIPRFQGCEVYLGNNAPASTISL